MKTIDDEHLEYEELIKGWGDVPNHNYLEVVKGLREPLQYIWQRAGSIHYIFSKTYLLVFTEQAIILKEADAEQVTRIPLGQVENFLVREVDLSLLTSDCCISFSYKRKKYYFYLNIKEYPENPRKYCRINFEMLLEKKFYGLLQDETE